MDTIINLFSPLVHALPIVFQWHNLLAVFIGMIIGIVVGAVPGISVINGIALILPFTFTLDPLVALGMMAGIYNAGSYGGAIPAILLRIPGTSASVATILDGYPMAQRGDAAYALKIAVISGTFGSVFSGIVLILFAPPLAQISLLFGPAEYFWVAIFGLCTTAVMVGEQPIKGLFAACLGLLLGMVGEDDTSGSVRFSFGILELEDHLSLVAVLTGMFGIPPAIKMCEEAIKTGMSKEALKFKNAPSVIKEWKKYINVWWRTSVVGVIIGILPGAAGAVSAFVAYNEAKRVAPDPETFGSGNPLGIAGAECGNGADNAAALIPALTLGIPGSGVAAVIMGGMLVHGLRPGLQLFQESPDVVYGFMLQMLLTALLLPVFGGLIATKIFAQILRLPRVLLVPMIFIITTVGVYTVHNTVIDIYVMLLFGILAYFMEKLNYPIPPVILGMILGPIIEQQFRLTNIIHQYNPTAFFSSYLSMILIILILFVLFFPLYRARRDKKKRMVNG